MGVWVWVWVWVGIGIVVGGVMTIVTRNAVHSVFYLVMVFVNASVLLVGMDVEYIALVFLVVYVGAVSVLFLFVVMMLKVGEEERLGLGLVPVGMVVAVVLLWEGMEVVGRYREGWGLGSGSEGEYIDWSRIVVYMTNVEVVGYAMYVEYGRELMVAGGVLLMAMVGAIELSGKEEKEVRRQSMYAQVETRSETRLYGMDR